MRKFTVAVGTAMAVIALAPLPTWGSGAVMAAGARGAPRTVTEFAKITPSDGYPVAFGASVAVSGDNLVVGAPGYITEDGVVGTAYVFHRVGPKWIEIGRLLPIFGGIDGEDLGFTVAIEGDYIVVGAPEIIGGYVGGGRGRAFIFRRYDRGTPDDPLDDLWAEDAELWTPDQIRAGDEFGSSVAISEGMVLIGRPGSTSEMSGSAYLYRKVNDVWRHVASLVPSDSALGDVFGWAVSLSGPVALVGAPFSDDAGSGSGAAYIFRESSGAWVQEQKLTASDAAPRDFFGDAVSLSTECAVVGALGNDDLGSTSGSAYVFRQGDGSAWEESKLFGADTGDSDQFGQALAAKADMLLVGAPKSDSWGSAYLFRRGTEGWIQERKLVASDRPSSQVLGVSVALGERYAFAAAAGAVYVYVVPSAAVTLRDFAGFQTCFRGEERGLATECARFDLVTDGRIDLGDFNEVLATLAGP